MSRRAQVKQVSWTAKDAVLALSKWYEPPEWAFMAQVRDGTGSRGSRYADAVALNLWPSRGMELHGFEIKTYRGDWVNEMRNPEKSCALQSYCDRWWLVIGPTAPGLAALDSNAIVRPGELPPTWGLISADKDGLTFIKEAPKLTAMPFDRPFVCSLLRNAAEIPDQRLQEEFKRGVEHGRKSAGDVGSLIDQLLHMESDVERLQRATTQIERAASNLRYASDRAKSLTGGNHERETEP